jgi:hypothetical protein
LYQEPIDWAIEVTPPGEPAPERRQSVLPSLDDRIRRAAMLDEEESAGGSQHPPHFIERSRNV